jgi:hypothetical protein
LRFFRAARLDFLRSSLLSVAVFAMSAFWICNLVIGKFGDLKPHRPLNQAAANRPLKAKS